MAQYSWTCFLSPTISGLEMFEAKLRTEMGYELRAFAYNENCTFDASANGCRLLQFHYIWRASFVINCMSFFE